MPATSPSGTARPKAWRIATPDGSGWCGFADRLAGRLAELNPDLGYANLAIRGRLARQIRAEQLEPALALQPDVASVIGGLNDILRPRVDLDAVAGTSTR
jgi:hypothetical protein